MILCCPECNTRFRVPDDMIGDSGRKVRCGACGHVWRVSGGDDRASLSGPDPIRTPRPDGPVPDHAVGHAAEPPFRDDLDDIDEDDDRGSAPLAVRAVSSDGDRSLKDEIAETMRRLRDSDDNTRIAGSAPPPAPLRPAPKKALIAGWLIWLAVMAALPASWYFGADAIREIWPATRKLDGIFGAGNTARGAQDQPVSPPSPSEALEVRIDGDPEWTASGDGWTLTVSGEVTNRAAVEVPAGRLDLILVDSENREIRRTSAGLARDPLTPGETRRFRTAIEDAPAETVGILHEWH